MNEELEEEFKKLIDKFEEQNKINKKLIYDAIEKLEKIKIEGGR